MSYTRSALLPVSPDEAFALITQPERLRRWQTVTATVDLRVGGGYRWTVTPGHVAEGTFREIEPGRRVVFGWGWDGSEDLPKDASTVTITIEPVDEGSRVTLVHEGLTESQAAMHAEGWVHYLERLERAAARGDAGPDEWAWSPEQLSPTVAAEAALAALQPVLRNLTQADREKPTPCRDFTVHQLADHLQESLVQVGALAGATLTVPTEGSLEDRVSVLAAGAVDAWRSVDLDGSLRSPGGEEVPATFLAGILPLELALHGWDLARATGQRLRLSEEVVGYIRDHTEDVVKAGRGSSFADEVTAPADADALDRFAAYAGRTAPAA